MPDTAWLGPSARFARFVWLGAGLTAIAGCGPREAGSIKLPEVKTLAGKPGFGPPAAKGSPVGQGPGDFRAAPAPRGKTARRSGVR
jgi:hypothetical protein